MGVASTTEIANLALMHLGVGKTIDDLASESTAEARAVRRFYETVLRQCLRTMHWPFATRFADLGLVEEDPTSEWAYSYRYPSGAIFIRRIFSGVRNDTRQSVVPYILSGDDSGQLILTDAYEAEIEYTKYVDDTQFYPDDFVMAFSWMLAMYLAPSMTAGDPFKFREYAVQMYRFHIAQAAANAQNETKRDEQPQSEFIRVR